MAGKVTNQQAVQATIKLEDFRKAVNTENTKNKGYVRFVPNGKDGVKIEKVNNKIDFKIGWRTNINAENNKLMRQKFVNAFKSDLRWVAKEKLDNLIDSITQKDGKENTAALSRKEIETAFKTYDDHMGTVSGRNMMYKNLIAAKAKECGVDSKELLEFIKTKNIQTVDHTKWTVLEPAGEEGGDMKLSMSADIFRGELLALEKILNTTVVPLLKAELVIKNVLADEVAVQQNELNINFGQKLTQEDMGKLRGVLLQYLQAKNLLDDAEEINAEGKKVGGGNGNIIGTSRMIFDKFMTDVLPKVVEDRLAMAHNSNYKDVDGIKKEDFLSVDTILKYAEEFMSSAKAFLDNPPDFNAVFKEEAKKLDLNSIDGQIDKNIIDQALLANKVVDKMAADFLGHQLFEKEIGDHINWENKGRKDPNKVDDYDLAHARLMSNANMAAIKREGLLASFTKIYMAKNGLIEIEPEKLSDAAINSDIKSNTSKAAAEAVTKLKIAYQVQLGEKNGEKVTNGANAYIDEMGKGISNIVDQAQLKYIDASLITELLTTYTLAKIMNEKMALAVHGVSASPQISNDSKVLQEDLKGIKSAVDACVGFESKLKSAMHKEFKLLDTALTNACKKGFITDEQKMEMLAQVRKSLNSVHTEALRAFFSEAPFVESENAQARLEQLFNEKLNVARADFKNMLALTSINQAVNQQFLKEAILDTETLFNEALKGRDHIFNGLITDTKALNLLKEGALKRLHTELLTEFLSKFKSSKEAVIKNETLKQFKASFNDRVNALLEKVKKAETALFEKCKANIKNGVTDIVDERILSKATHKIANDVKNNYINKVTDCILVAMQSNLQKTLETLFTSPEVFTLKNKVNQEQIDALALKLVGEKSINSPAVVFNNIKEEYTTNVKTFLNNRGISQLEESLKENAIFTGNGKLAHLGPNERDAFIHRVAMDMEARLKAMPEFYGDDPSQLLPRLTQEAIDDLNNYVTSTWNSFRTAYFKSVETINANYDFLGKENLAKIADYMLQEVIQEAQAFTGKNCFDVSAVANKYKGELEAEVKERIEAKLRALEEYKKAVDEVLKPLEKKWNEWCNTNMGDLSKTLSPDGMEHLNNILKRKWNDLVSKVYREPENFTVGNDKERLKKIAENQSPKDVEIELTAKAFMGLLNRVILANDLITNDANLEKRLEKLGFGDFLKDPTSKDMVLKIATEALSGEHIVGIVTDVEKELMEHILSLSLNDNDSEEILNAIDAETCAPTTSNNAIERLNTILTETIRNNSLSLLHEPFQNDKVEEAHTAFNSWISAYKFNDAMSYDKNTMNDKLQGEFNKRVHLLQEQTLKGGTAEKILSDDFIKHIDRIIDSVGIESEIQGWKDTVAKEWITQFTKHDDWYFFDAANAKEQSHYAIVNDNYRILSAEISRILSDKVSGLDDGVDFPTLRGQLQQDEYKMETVLQSLTLDVAHIIEACKNRFSFEASSQSVIKQCEKIAETKLLQALTNTNNPFPSGIAGFIQDHHNDTTAQKYAATFDKLSGYKTTIQQSFLTLYLAASQNERYNTVEFKKELDQTGQKFVDDLLKAKTKETKAVIKDIKAMIKGK